MTITKTITKTAALTAALAIAGSAVAIPTAAAGMDDGPVSIDYSGTGVVDTAASAAVHMTWTKGATTVYLSRADVASDALVAGQLTDGPVLLLPAKATSAPATVKGAIARLKPTRVIALGGPAAVSESALRSAAGQIPTDRLAGASRYETAVAISRRANPTRAKALALVPGETAADAAVAGQLDAAILPIPSRGAIPAAILAEAKRIKPAQTLAIGATNQHNAKAIAKVASRGSLDYLAGGSRYETAAIIAAYAYPSKETVETAYLVPGTDEMTAIILGSATDGPVLYVHDQASTYVAANLVRELGPRRVAVVASKVSGEIGTAVAEIRHAAHEGYGNKPNLTSAADCARLVTDGLEAGWTATCTIAPIKAAQPYRTDIPTGTITVDLRTWLEDRDGTAKAARASVEGMPKPVNITPAVQACQEIVDRYAAKHRNAIAKRWTFACIDRPEMPVSDEMRVKGWEPWGLAYTSRPYGGLILVNAGPGVPYEAVTSHEWGHALADAIPAAQQDKLAARFGLPFYGGDEYPRNVTETIAQSYAECQGYTTRTDYLGMQCSTLRSIWSDAGITGHGMSVAELPRNAGKTYID